MFEKSAELVVAARQSFTASYLEKIWREVRKFGGICMAVIQNIVDLLRTKEVETMLGNSGYISLLSQSTSLNYPY